MFPSLSNTPTFNDIFRMLRQKHMGDSAAQSTGATPAKSNPSLTPTKPLGESNGSAANANVSLLQQLQAQRTLDALNKSLNLENQPNKALNLHTLLSALQNKLKEKTLAELGLPPIAVGQQQVPIGQLSANSQDSGNKRVKEETDPQEEQVSNPNIQFIDCENDPSYASLFEARSKKIKKMNTCGHPDRPHYAKNMCNQCYHKFGRTKKPWKCNHERLYAHGLCQNCYINAYNKKRSQKLKEDPTDTNSSPQSTNLLLEGASISDSNQEPLVIEDKLASQDRPLEDNLETPNTK